MHYVYTLYILPLIAAALVSGFVAIYGWTRRATPGALALIHMAIGMFIWTVCYAFEVAATTVELKYFWGVIEYFGIVTAPYSWMLFAISYSGHAKILTRRFYAWTMLFPAATLGMILTNHWHHQVWSDYRITPQDNFYLPNISYGAWFWVHAAYSYAMILTGVALLVWVMRRRQGLYRGQVNSLLVAVLAPFVGNILYLSGNSPIPYLDLTPFAFTVSVAALAWAIFGFHLVDIAPLARELVLDSMQDGMIVLHKNGYVVDINNSAARMIGIPAADAIGKAANEIFSPWAHLVERFSGVWEADEKIEIGTGEARRQYEVHLSPLLDSQGLTVGRMIMLRALDAGAPQPRFARSAAVSDTRPAPEVKASGADSKKSIWERVIGYYSVRTQQDLPVPPGSNPGWYRARERIFTMIARIAASVGTVALLFTIEGGFLRGINMLFAVLVIFLWALGALRHIDYQKRVSGFLALIYVLSFAEVLNYGFSVEAFNFFLGFVVSTAVLTSRRGTAYTFGLAVATLSVFAVLIGSGNFAPFSQPVSYLPNTIFSGINSVIVFTASSLAVTASVLILIENLNSAWQKETQALNLLQQERDLLEQRVEERTFDLEEARDSAIRSNVELRKYYRAIEQSGNSIIITDVNGNIEYANPKFEEVSGYALEEILGKNPRVLKSGKHRPQFYQNLWATISAGHVWTGTFHNRRKDGSLHWESATIAPVIDQNGEVVNYVAIQEDITERRQAEEQLRKLSQAVEQSGNSVIIMDDRGCIEYVNPKFSEVTGYLPEEVIGRDPSFLYGLGSDYDFTQDEAWKTVSSGRIWRGEFQNRRKDGALFWESATIAPVQDSSGEIINFVEIKQDVTEEKILQVQLQRQNDYLSILHQVTLDLLNRRDLDNLLQTIVERSAALLEADFCELRLEKDGYLVAEAFTGNQPYSKGDRASREQAKLSWQAFDTCQPVMISDYATSQYRRAIYSTQAWHATIVFPIMAGERCLGTLAVGREKPDYAFTPEQVQTGILFTRLVALTLDNASLYTSAMSELAERKRAEALLQESEAQFRQIVENASDIIYRTDMQGNFTYANPAALRLMGYTSEQDVLGKSYLDLTTPEYRHKLKRAYDHQYISKKMTTYYEFPAITIDGQIVWVGQNVQIIMDGEDVVGFQAVARNITQLKQAQDALALSRDQALDASRFKSQLLSRVSHELRTPLGGILGYAELLHYQAFGDLNEKQKNAVNNIVESTHYLTSIVNDLLDEAQIEANSLTLHYEYFDPSLLIEKVSATVSVLAGRKGLTFNAEVFPDLPTELYGDSTRLQQIIVNLAGNAVKFTQAGEVSVKLDCPAPAQWRIQVRDTGVGIPQEEQQNIFEPFRQMNNAITRENRGSGLGLAITKQLVELMGGQIQLESEVGKGSTFTITLPMKNAPEEKP